MELRLVANQVEARALGFDFPSFLHGHVAEGFSAGLKIRRRCSDRTRGHYAQVVKFGRHAGFRNR